jgi:hypothetical protein
MGFSVHGLASSVSQPGLLHLPFVGKPSGKVATDASKAGTKFGFPGMAHLQDGPGAV